jgi:hypothetical protein
VYTPERQLIGTFLASDLDRTLRVIEILPGSEPEDDPVVVIELA